MAAAKVKALLETSRFDKAILPQLEKFIDDSSNYDLEVHLATLKLYQFHPDELKTPTVAKVLMKALMRLPQSDFLACTYLVPERVLDAEPISHIISVAALLERCQFREFWEALAPLATQKAALPDFDASVRAFMLRTLEITYQSVPVAHVRASLGLADAKAVAALVDARKWQLAGDVYKVALNEDNAAKPKRAQDAGEAMGSMQMSKALASVAAAACATSP